MKYIFLVEAQPSFKSTSYKKQFQKLIGNVELSIYQTQVSNTSKAKAKVRISRIN